jgi:hypothetical protein
MLHATVHRSRALVAAITSSITIPLMTINGCASSQQSAAETAPVLLWTASTGSGALVIAPAADTSVNPLDTWEYARRDTGLGSVEGPFVTVFSAAHVRHHERLSTVDGRPRNHSWTYSRATQVIVQP